MSVMEMQHLYDKLLKYFLADFILTFAIEIIDIEWENNWNIIRKYLRRELKFPILNFSLLSKMFYLHSIRIIFSHLMSFLKLYSFIQKFFSFHTLYHRIKNSWIFFSKYWHRNKKNSKKKTIKFQNSMMSVNWTICCNCLVKMQYWTY